MWYREINVQIPYLSLGFPFRARDSQVRNPIETKSWKAMRQPLDDRRMDDADNPRPDLGPERNKNDENEATDRSPTGRGGAGQIW